MVSHFWNLIFCPCVSQSASVIQCEFQGQFCCYMCLCPYAQVTLSLWDLLYTSFTKSRFVGSYAAYNLYSFWRMFGDLVSDYYL